MMRWVTDVRELESDLVQLTSDSARSDAHRFYERLGFTGSDSPASRTSSGHVKAQNCSHRRLNLLRTLPAVRRQRGLPLRLVVNYS